MADRQALLDAIADEIRAHGTCGFDVCEQATNMVPGEGSATAAVVVVGKAPGASEDAHHLPWLRAQLEVIGPRLIVPVGRHALKRFAPRAAIGEVHGRVLEVDGRTLFPMYHPAAAMHNQRLLPTLVADARALREVLAS